MFAALIAFAVVAQSPPEVVYQIKLDYPGPPAPVLVQLDPGEWRATEILPRVMATHATAGGRTTTTVHWGAVSWGEVVTKRSLARVVFRVNGAVSTPLGPGGLYAY